MNQLSAHMIENNRRHERHQSLIHKVLHRDQSCCEVVLSAQSSHNVTRGERSKFVFESPAQKQMVKAEYEKWFSFMPHILYKIPTEV